ncbi:hypothetical protein BP5796_10788 [Coleophoma crateriformis]|uniref:Uncharacterized protein n=1 Tax=Coleophoma crateriformis TaxID=565419 RepID=A0A3D8QKY0_9HELO|nr:hypothetical protein BP5796_10788 [Coleophoma crateriformis]
MDSNIYLGVWTNYSNGTVLGATLTTTREKGFLLASFTGFVIAFVGSRFWNIICLILHRCYSTSESRDTIHHQRQVILRNSSSPDSGLVSLISLLWAWRKSGTKTKPYSRICPAILWAIGCIAMFTAATAFSSQISSSAGIEVLLNGNKCGIMTLPQDNLSITTEPETILAKRINDAANYAKQCYSTNSSGLLGCDKFVVQTLPTVIWDNNTACPFKDGICKSNNSNLLLDTGFIDSHDHLGINAPENERFAWRYSMHCGPLVTQGFSEQFVFQNTTWVAYKYGGHTNSTSNYTITMDYTIEIEGVDAQYAQVSRFSNQPNYGLLAIDYQTSNGYPYPSASSFMPIPQLLRPDGDGTIVFLSGDGVLFSEPMNGDWYHATEAFMEYKLAESTQAQTEGTMMYRLTEAASPLGCVEQWQWCNSAYARSPAESGCGPLASFTDSLYRAAPYFNLTGDEVLNVARSNSSLPASQRFVWQALLQSYSNTNIGSILTTLGAKSLASQSLMNSGSQLPLPDNQWQLDVTNWWNIILALLQLTYVDTGQGVTSSELLEFQKIRSTSYTSFNLFALLLIYIGGGLIVVTSFSLEPILACLQRRRKHKEYSYLEWSTNSTLQLHRLTQEELQIGTWSGCTDKIPITKADEILGSLDISDIKHPVLTRTASATTEKIAPTLHAAKESNKYQYKNQTGHNEILAGSNASSETRPVKNVDRQSLLASDTRQINEAETQLTRQNQSSQETGNDNVAVGANTRLHISDEAPWSQVSVDVSDEDHYPRC